MLMMFKLLSVLVKLAVGLIGYLERKQLLDVGEARANAKQLTEALDKTRRAIAARRAALRDFDGVPDKSDPNLRD